MKRIKLLLASVVASSALLLPAVVAPVTVQAQLNQEICTGIGFTEDTEGGETDCGNDTEAENALGRVINTIIDVFSIVVGAVSVIMIILGGLRYITSAGDSSNVQSARNTILYAVVGLVIVIFAQTVVKFVVTRVTAEGDDA